MNANATVANGATSSGVLKIMEDSDNGSNFASFQVPSLAANTVYILPTTDGNSGEYLQTDGSGTLTWATASGSQTPWTSDINGAGKSLMNVNDLEVTNNLTLYNLTLTNLGGTGVFLSLSNNIVVKTNIPGDVTAAQLAGATNESTLEGFLDLQDLQGAVTDAQVPNTITVEINSLSTNALIGTGPFLVVSNNVVVRSNAPASSSSVTFEPTQFSVGAGGTNLISGVPLTNSVNRIVPGVFLEDRDNGDNLIEYSGTAYEGTQDGLIFAQGVVTAVGFQGNGANVTNINPANLTVGNAALATITADGFSTRTNLFTINSAIALGTNFTYVGGAATWGITGVTGNSGSERKIAELEVLASGDITFTNHASFYASDGVDTRTLTNGNLTTIAVVWKPGLYTNLIFTWSK